MKKNLITKYEGAISFLLNARLNLYVTSLSKNWQYDFLTFSVERGSVPRFELTPMNTSTVIISPFTVLASTFVGGRNVLIDNFYAAGSINVNSGNNPLTVYTGTDPNTGEMTVLASLSRNGNWSEPVEVGRAAGVVSVAGEQLLDGRYVIAWSEILGTDLMDPYPSTLIKYAISDTEGTEWSAPETIAITNETAFDLRIAGTDDALHLIYLSTPDGPLATNKSLWTSSLVNDQWTTPEMLLEPQAILEYSLSGQGSTACLMASTTIANGIHELVWEQGAWGEPSLIVQDADFPLDVVFDKAGDLLLFWKSINGDLNVSRRGASSGEWTHTTGIVSGSNASSLELQPLQVDEQDVLLLAYDQGADRTDIWSTWTTPDGTKLIDPRPLTLNEEGSYHDLQIRPIAENVASLVALHSVGDRTIVRDIPIAFPTRADCDADGIDDFVAIAAGLANDCNENGVPDTCDLLFGDSTDFNRNLIPDECETVGSPDCDGNGVLDRDEIELGILQDLNTNGIPDNCEEDISDTTTIVRAIQISTMETQRYFRADDLSILANDSTILLLEFSGELEASSSPDGPWTIIE